MRFLVSIKFKIYIVYVLILNWIVDLVRFELTTMQYKALSKAVSRGREDPHAVLKRLVAISTLTKRTLPRASRIYKADARWVHSKYSKMFGRR